MKSLFHIVLAMFGLSVALGSSAYASDIPPPQSDSWIVPSQFLACSGNSYALCYYSGPEIPTPSRLPNANPPAMPCEMNPNSPANAACTCYAVTGAEQSADNNPLGLVFQYNYVLLTGILQSDTLKDTLAECGPLGSRCLNLANLNACAASDFNDAGCTQAKVCSMLGNVATGERQTLYSDKPEVDLVSTFSFDQISQHSFGSTPCDGLYAGCMTAPCGPDANGLTTCQCPTYNGPYQVGQQKGRLDELGLGCDLETNVWSAANRIKPGGN
ncbi:MAG: hypothetical protein Tsb0019_31970 [Roseibium sp.]